MYISKLSISRYVFIVFNTILIFKIYEVHPFLCSLSSFMNLTLFPLHISFADLLRLIQYPERLFQKANYEASLLQFCDSYDEQTILN